MGILEHCGKGLFPRTPYLDSFRLAGDPPEISAIPSHNAILRPWGPGAAYNLIATPN